MQQEHPYWLKKPKPKVLARIKEIRDLWATTERTVRNICYKLYPKLHGKALDRAYNTTVKDVVRGRLHHGILWENIRESRVKYSSGTGWANTQYYIDYLEGRDVSEFYSRDKTPSHKCRFEVWFEKDTVAPEFGRVCRKYDIPFLSCRGQLTWSAKKKASERLGSGDLVLYFGDNDEKGREIFEVIKFAMKYLGVEATFLWAGLTDEQEEKYNLPEDCRLDGMELEDLQGLIEAIVLEHIDLDEFNEILKQERKDIEFLKGLKIKVIGNA